MIPSPSMQGFGLALTIKAFCSRYYSLVLITLVPFTIMIKLYLPFNFFFFWNFVEFHSMEKEKEW